MSELKRCPFCNAEVKLMFLNQNTYEDAVWDESIGNVHTWFKCYGCDSEFFHDEPIDTPEKQVEWWNTRKPLERIVKLLKEKAFPDFEEEYTCNGEELLYLSDAIEIVREEGGLNE